MHIRDSIWLELPAGTIKSWAGRERALSSIYSMERILDPVCVIIIICRGLHQMGYKWISCPEMWSAPLIPFDLVHVCSWIAISSKHLYGYILGEVVNIHTTYFRNYLDIYETRISIILILGNPPPFCQKQLLKLHFYLKWYWSENAIASYFRTSKILPIILPGVRFPLTGVIKWQPVIRSLYSHYTLLF